MKNKGHLKMIAALLALYALVALVPLPEAEAVQRPARAEEPAEEAPAIELAVAPARPAPRPRPRTAPAPPAANAPSAARAPIEPQVEQRSAASAATGDEADMLDGPPPDPFVDQKIAAIRERWERESDDPEWTKQAREEAVALFAAKQLPEELLHEVRCRRTVCRIAVDATDRMRMAGLAQHLQDNVPDAYFSVIEDEAFAYMPR